jgi:hypothetical protein
MEAGSVPAIPTGSPDVLRDKYLDYCSAQLADLLLYLSPDEIYLLAHRAANESDDPGIVSYDRMVRLATRWLQKKVALPPFDVWVEDYRAHPDVYEEYLMGLWEETAAASGG